MPNNSIVHTTLPNLEEKPNEKTIRAMEDSLNGKMYKADSFEEFLQQMINIGEEE